MFFPLTASSRLLRGASLVLLPLLVPGVPDSKHWRKLSGPMPRASLGDVKDFQLVPGQARVVYLADADANEVFELYSRALTPGARAVRLHTFFGDAADVLTGFQVDPSGRRAVFSRWNGSTSTYSVPVDGSAAPVGSPGGTFSPDGARLLFTSGSFANPSQALLSVPSDGSSNPVSLAGAPDDFGKRRVLAYAVTADSARVVFLGDRRVTGDDEVYSVPIDGSAPMKALNGTLQVERDVTSFQVRADGQQVVYRSDEGANERYELYRAPIDGSAARVRVTPTLAFDRDVAEGYRLSPDGTWLAFAANLDSALVNELYAVPLAGPAVAHKLSPPLAAGGSIQLDLRISADSSRVLYLADPEADGVFELYSAPLDGSAAPVRLFALGAGETLGRYELSGDGSRVVYLLDDGQQELFSVPLDGSAAPVRLHPALVPGGDVVRFELAGTRVVYRADQEADERFELFSAPLDGSAPAVRLHDPLAPGRTILPDFRVASDGGTVGFVSDLAFAGRFELFVAPADGSAPAALASDPAVGAPVPVGSVVSVLPAGESVVYRADQETDGVWELFTVPRDGHRSPQRLHPPAVTGGEVGAFEVTADQHDVVFQGALALAGVDELYRVPADASAPPLKLNGPLVAGGSVDSHRLSPNGTWVVYQADALRDGQVELFSRRFDGTGALHRLDPATHVNFGDASGFEISPDSQRVAFRTDKFFANRLELFSVPIDGSAAAVRLTTMAIAGGTPSNATFTADSAWVVYTADAEVNERYELYSVPALGGTAKKLNPPIAGTTDIGSFAVGASNRVLFVIHQKLYGAPVDGSSAAQPLFAAQTDSYQFWLTPNRTKVLVNAFQTGQSSWVLFCGPVDGSSPPVLLPGSIPAGGGNMRVLFPNENWVVFTGPYGTFRAPLDGSQAATLIDQSGDPRELSADGQTLLTFGATFNLPNDGVYLQPSDGSAPARRITPPRLQGGPIIATMFWAGFGTGGDVLYSIRNGYIDPIELYVTGPAPVGRARAR